MDKSVSKVTLAVVRRTIMSLLLQHNLTIVNTAQTLGTSPRTLYRRLNQTGTTYAQLVDECRLNIAHKLLSWSDTKVYEIAAVIGYKDPSSFSRAFYRLTGQSPTQYRVKARHRKKTLP